MSVVMKFGGTSVADEDAFRRVVAIVRRQIERQGSQTRPPIVVVSALSKVTDGLLRGARSVEAGERDQAVERLDSLAERHVAIASRVTRGARQTEVARDLRTEFTAIAEMVQALAPLKELAPSLFDATP